MARREAPSLAERRRRAALLEALRLLRREAREKKLPAATELKVARAYRALSKTSRATHYFRHALARLRSDGEAVRALAVAKELADLSGNTAALADLAKRVGRANPPRIAVPLPPDRPRVARPIEPVIRDEKVVPADAILKVHDAAEVAAEEPGVSGPIAGADDVQPLVPPDVLAELADRGEILWVPPTSLVPQDVLAELQRRGEVELVDERPEDEEPLVVSDSDLVLEEPPGTLEAALAGAAASPGAGSGAVAQPGQENPAAQSPDLDAAADTEEPADEAPEPIAEASVSEAIDTEDVIDNLARVPLFSDLPRAAFVELARRVTVLAYEQGQLMFSEGEPATSFYLVADGGFEAVRDIRGVPTLLKQVGVGDVIGVFGVYGEKRRAATVRAVQESLAIEIPQDALESLLERHPIVRLAIQRFYRERLLDTFLASSPLFADLNVTARHELARRFEEKRLAPGAVLVAPGEVFNGLFLVLSGTLRIHRRASPGHDEEVAQIHRGQFFGIVSALSGMPVRVQVTAVETGSVCYVPQKVFNDFVREHPTLRGLPSRLAEEGMLVEKDVFVGKTGIPGLS